MQTNIFITNNQESISNIISIFLMFSSTFSAASAVKMKKGNPKSRRVRRGKSLTLYYVILNFKLRGNRYNYFIETKEPYFYSYPTTFRIEFFPSTFPVQ